MTTGSGSLGNIQERAETFLDRAIGAFRGRTGRTRDPIIVPYSGYQHASGTRVLGRVMEQPGTWSPLETDSRWANMRGIGTLFATHEIAHAPVALRDGPVRAETATDHEGYIDETIPADGLPERTAWDTIEASLSDVDSGASEAMPVLRVGRNARFGIVSDIDDTVMQTGAENLARNLWTTFTGNPLTRHVYRHVPALYRGLVEHGGVPTNPVFYLSSSPWNLYSLIEEVLKRNHVPRGPIFLRDFGLDRDKFIKNTHGQHKVGNAVRLLDQFDGLPFILIGDLGQADAEVYADVARQRPGQVIGVILHQPSDRSHDAKLRHVAEFEALGIPSLVTRDYADAIALAREKGWMDD